MMNLSMADAHKDAPDDFRRLLRAQLAHTKAMIESYLERDEMPHEWGSIDSADYMNAALELSSEFFREGVFGDPLEYLKKISSAESETSYILSNFACDGVADELYQYANEEEL